MSIVACCHSVKAAVYTDDEPGVANRIPWFVLLRRVIKRPALLGTATSQEPADPATVVITNDLEIVQIGSIIWIDGKYLKSDKMIYFHLFICFLGSDTRSVSRAGAEFFGPPPKHGL